jgi:hypothetical protein
MMSHHQQISPQINKKKKKKHKEKKKHVLIFEDFSCDDLI